MDDYSEGDWTSILESLTKQAEHMGCSQYDAQDMAQQALVKTLNAVAKGKQLHDVHSYAGQTVTRLIITAGKSRQRKKSVSIDAILAAVDRGVDMPEALVVYGNPETVLFEKEYDVQVEVLRAVYAPMCTDPDKSHQYRAEWRNRYQQARKELG